MHVGECWNRGSMIGLQLFMGDIKVFCHTRPEKAPDKWKRAVQEIEQLRRKQTIKMEMTTHVGDDDYKSSSLFVF